MNIQPISSISVKNYQSNVDFSGRNNDKKKNLHINFNPAKKLAVPLAATVLAINTPVSVKSAESSANYPGVATELAYEAPSVSRSSANAKVLDLKTFDNYKVSVKPMDTDRNSKTAETLRVEISTPGGIEKGSIQSVGTANLNITGALESEYSELLSYNQTVVKLDSDPDMEYVLFDQDLHDYVMDFAQNKLAVKNNGAVKVKNLDRDMRTVGPYGLDTRLFTDSWLESAKHYQFDYEKKYGEPSWTTDMFEIDNGRAMLYGYNNDSNEVDAEVITLRYIPDNIVETGKYPVLELKGLTTVKSQLMDMTGNIREIEYPAVELYCRGWNSTVYMVDQKLYDNLMELKGDDVNNNANIKFDVKATTTQLVSGTGAVSRDLNRM